MPSSNTEKPVHDHNQSPSVSTDDYESEVEIEPIQSRRQQQQQQQQHHRHHEYPEVIGTGDGLLTPQISRLSQTNSLARKTTSIGTTGTTDPNFEVDWTDENDPENPWNWPLPYKAMCISFLSWNTLVM
jgi:hypothetical protein